VLPFLRGRLPGCCLLSFPFNLLRHPR
jgi:hypothetical protein